MTAKKSRLEYLISLISSLTEDEILSIKQFLVCFDPNFKEGHKVKTLQLLEYILEANFEVEEEDILEDIYGGDSDSNAFRFICMRLISKIYDWLTLDIAIERKGNFSEANSAYVFVVKKLAQVVVLWERGVTHDIPKTLNQVIKKALEYEFYSQVIEALIYKQNFLGIRNGISEFEKVGKEIKRFEAIKSAIKNAQDCFSLIQYQSDLKAGKPEIADLIDEKQEEIKRDYEEFKSPLLGYHYYSILLAKNNLEGDYGRGSKICLKILDLLNNNTSINRPNRKANIYLQLANNEIYNNKVHNARQYAIEATKIITPNSINYFIAKEFEFLSCFYLDYIEEAEKCCFELLEGKQFQRNKAQMERVHYYYAALLFEKGEFGEAWNQLQNISALLGDKEGWNLGVRILLILIQIENQQIDGLELSLDNLRKHISKLTKTGVIKDRFKHIYKILNGLVRGSLDFVKTYESSEKEVKELESDDPNYRWNINSHELIKFHEWFRKNYRKAK